MLVQKCSICCKANEFTRKLDRSDIDGEDYLLKLRYIAPEVEWCHNHQICGRCVADLTVACKFKELCLNVQRHNLNEDFYCKRNSDIKLNYQNENSISREEKNDLYQIKSKTFICHNCKIPFDNKNDLTKHIEQEHTEKNMNTSIMCEQNEDCSKCGRKFTSSTLLKEHYLVCCNISGLSKLYNEYQSGRSDKHILTSYRKKCKQGTLGDNKGISYEKNQHNQESVCKFCQEKKYNKNKKFSCEICNETFAIVEKLIEHCVVMHSIDDKSVKPYSCYICNHRFKSCTDLVTHNLYHDQTGTNSCTFCYNDSKIQIDRPLTYNEDDLINCLDCNIIFRSKSELNHHLDVIHRADIVCIDDAVLENNINNEHQKGENALEFQKDEQHLISLKDVNIHTLVCNKYQSDNCHEFSDKKSLSSSHIGNKHCKESMNATEQQSKGPFICETCKNFYTSVRNLNLHKLYCGEQDLDFTNKGKDKSNEVPIVSKNNRKSRKTIRTFTCEICSEKFNYIKLALEHYVVQHSIDEKSVKLYACEICKQRFSSSTNLQKHHKYHDKNRNKICSICGKSFITKSDLMVHEYTHYNRRNYKCIKCNKAFNTNKNFWTHNLVVHTDPSQWKHVCNKCDKRFALKASYDQHVKRHNGEKKFSCHICSKLFISRSEVKRHVDLHSNIKQFKCSYCDKEYKYHKTLKAHISTVHTKGTPKISVRQKNFVCHICPSQFYDKQKLARHLCGHTGVKPFPCRLCERKFTDKSYLKYHLKIAHKIFEQNQE